MKGIAEEQVDNVIPELIFVAMTIGFLLAISTGVGEAATDNKGEKAYDKIVETINDVCETGRNSAYFYVSLPDTHSIKIYGGDAGEAPDIELRKEGSEEESTAFEMCGGDSSEATDLVLEERSISNTGQFEVEIIENDEDEKRIEIER